MMDWKNGYVKNDQEAWVLGRMCHSHRAISKRAKQVRPTRRIGMLLASLMRNSLGHDEPVDAWWLIPTHPKNGDPPVPPPTPPPRRPRTRQPVHQPLRRLLRQRRRPGSAAL
jgi:hypothetical protein